MPYLRDLAIHRDGETTDQRRPIHNRVERPTQRALTGSPEIGWRGHLARQGQQANEGHRGMVRSSPMAARFIKFGWRGREREIVDLTETRCDRNEHQANVETVLAATAAPPDPARRGRH